MNRAEHRQLLSGLRLTSIGTFTSRVLGLARDIPTAALLGLADGAAMDAFVVAFRVPNMFRRLLGEGALTASFLPVLTAELERDRQAAWRLVSVALVLLAVLLAAIVLVGEAVCAVMFLLYGNRPDTALVVGLSAVLLPYTFFICLAAQLAATLHALGRFGVPAFSPAILNVVWIVTVIAVAPRVSSDPRVQTFVLATAIVIAGVLQLAFHVPVLWALGFRFDFNWQASSRAIVEVVQALGPMVFGLAATQLNSFVDSLIAWGLARGAGEPETIAWLGDQVRYPMQQGAAAAIWYGERMCHFPVGILGLATATAIFPLLSRHAARGDHAAIRRDLTLGLQLVIFLGVPAAAGLALVAEPMVTVLFERGAFTASDSLRTTHIITAYAIGVWAFCALPVVVRGFYALGDRLTPVRVAMVVVGLNFTLNLILVWPLAERGLALSTALGAVVQVVALTALFARRYGALAWRPLGTTITKTLAGTAMMAAAGYTILLVASAGAGFLENLARLIITFCACVAVYFITARLLRQGELALVFGRAGDLDSSQSDR